MMISNGRNLRTRASTCSSTSVTAPYTRTSRGPRSCRSSSAAALIAAGVRHYPASVHTNEPFSMQLLSYQRPSRRNTQSNQSS